VFRVPKTQQTGLSSFVRKTGHFPSRGRGLLSRVVRPVENSACASQTPLRITLLVLVAAKAERAGIP